MAEALQALLARSQRALAQGQFELAQQYCAQALARSPRSPAAHTLGAAIAVRRGEEGQAQHHLRAVLEQMPTHADSWFNLGNSYRRSASIADAEVAYRRCLGAKPDHLSGRRALSNLLLAQGHAEAAAEVAESGLAMHGTDARLRTLLGDARLALEEHEAALRHFLAALDRQPGYERALQGQAIALRGLDEPEAALEILQDLERRGIEDFSLAHNLGNVLSDLGRLEEAASAYEHALKQNPGYGPSYSNLARTRWCLGDSTGFLEPFESAFARGASDPELVKAYLDALLAVGAVDRFRAALSEFPASVLTLPALQDTLGRSHAEGGDFEAANACHRRALAAEGAPTSWHCHAAQTALRAGEPARAAAILEPALAREPQNGFLIAYLSIAWALLNDPRADALTAGDLISVVDLGVPENFASSQSFHGALKAELAAHHTARQHPFEQTLRGGTQTQGNILRQQTPAVRALRSQLEAAVDEALERLRARTSQQPHSSFEVPEQWGFAGAWSVRLAPGGFHTMHMHPMGFLSAVYYVEAPPADASDPTAGWLQFGPPDIALPSPVPVRKRIEPVAGRLVLFPSYFWHGTQPFWQGGDRITVAFDVAGRR